MKGRGIRQVLRSGRYIEGILVTRHERFIETWKPRTKGISWNNYMRQVGVHIDFPPELDEMFGVTPDKQTLAPRDELIDMLHNKGLFKAIADLYKAVDKERHVSKAERASEQLKELGATSITEEVMDKFDSMTRPSPKSDDDLATRREEARKNLERTIKERAAKADVPEESIQDLVIAETEERRFKVERVPLGANGVFYNPVQRGAQKSCRSTQTTGSTSTSTAKSRQSSTTFGSASNYCSSHLRTPRRMPQVSEPLGTSKKESVGRTNC